MWLFLATPGKSIIKTAIGRLDAAAHVLHERL